jgi:hypothetical protein
MIAETSVMLSLLRATCNRWAGKTILRVQRRKQGFREFMHCHKARKKKSKIHTHIFVMLGLLDFNHAL